MMINSNNNFVCSIDLLEMDYVHPRCNPFPILNICLGQLQFDATVYKQVVEKNDCMGYMQDSK